MAPAQEASIIEYLDGILERLTTGCAIGYAGDVPSLIEAAAAAEGLRAVVERDHSVTVHLKGSGRGAVMLACHIDEIGLIVDRIDDAGRIFFSTVGGIDPRILPGQAVMVLGRERCRGYIAIKPPHLMDREELKRVPRLEDLFIDTGRSAAAVRESVSIGDCVCFDVGYGRMEGDLRTAKALDNRASVACGIAVLRELARLGHGLDVHFVATSQEEFTGMGARIHAYRLPVDYAVVIDVSHGEHPDLKDHERFPLKAGPTIIRGATVPAVLSDRLIGTAQRLGIPYQIEPAPGDTATDADDIAFSRSGIPTCIVGIPVRYMHTPVEIVALGDIEAAVRLVTDLIRNLEMPAT